MSEPFFKNIPIFKWSDLADKTLDIRMGQDGDVITVVGRDRDSGKIYVLFSGVESE